ncbi:MAG: hypothetical protein F2663_05850 [Actinobacteria bacterium]|uniref:Unannotated protein n=1 Tax=freshwater metagenome TaxID=449393 RepID=A0A6J6PIL4_9ZZZZ|nr:hypothetical protein [Actinomycetota bacterium]
MSTALETAVVLVVEPDGGPLTDVKARYNAPSIASGMPVHLTLLYPFVAPAEIDGTVFARLDDVVARHSTLSFALAEISLFPGGFVCLDPDPAEPVEALMHDLWHAFPECPPYGGEVAQPHPHVTVGKAVPEAHAEALAETVALEIRGKTPFERSVSAVTIMTRFTSGEWQPLRTLPLTG